MIQRNLKRTRTVNKYAEKRKELKKTLSDPKTNDELFYLTQRQLNQFPRNSSPIRQRNRCAITGRPRAYIRRFGLSRIAFRELAIAGQIPGVTKSSW